MLEELPKNFSSIAALSIWLIELGIGGIMKLIGDNCKGWMTNKRVQWRFYICFGLLGLILVIPNMWLKVLLLVYIATYIQSLFFILPHDKAISVVLDDSGIEKLLLRHSRWLSASTKIAFYRRLVSHYKDYELDKVYLHYLDTLKGIELLKSEKEKYLLPAIGHLFLMGSIKRLDEELENLKDLDDTWLYNHLVCCSCHQKCDYEGMKRALRKIERLPNISTKRLIVEDINMVSAAMESGDKELYLYYINKLENYFIKEKTETVESLGDLLYYYSQNNEFKKANDIIKYIQERDYDDFDEMSSYFDLIYSYYKEKGNRNECIKVAMYLNHKSHEMLKSQERRMLYDLQILRIAFETDYGWQEFSIQFIHDRERYCSYSYKTAVTFASIVHIINHDALEVRNKILSDKALDDLCNSIVNHEKSQWLSYRINLLAEMPAEMLYARNNLRMDAWTISYFISEKDNNNLDKYLRERMRIVSLIIDECEQCDNLREELHYINIMIDEVITFLILTEKFKDDPNVMVISTNKAYYIKIADKYIDKMSNICERYKYNRFLTYYLLFLSRYFLFKKDKDQAIYFLNKFENYNVKVTNFTLSIQKMYKALKEDTKM
jgi:hypothetical protein